ncbi:multidrug resistance 1-like protein [Labeo rohita]|uniref:Multidrug resistance 1-like protein n=1 Tax=Labeo rohita TaxID=84645 RepID=A0A498L1W3_LABRO|nr:multidrug resistance 1-like protein [Labeo rohita]
MPAAFTDLNGGSAKLEASLKCPEKALLSPNATLLMTGNSGLVSMTTGNSGVSSMVAEDLGVAFKTARVSGAAKQTGDAATLADEVTDLNYHQQHNNTKGR